VTALDQWLRAHAYLQPVARFLAGVEPALDRLTLPGVALPAWDDYRGDHAAGIPLLQSANAAVGLEPAGAVVLALVDRLAAGDPHDGLAGLAKVLAAEIDRRPGAAQRVVDWLLGDGDVAPSCPGVLRFRGWRAVARTLAPVLTAYAQWRDEDRWLRCHCPVCGALPAMARLVGADPVRLRLLCCGACGTQWRYQRTACPFCDSDAQRLGVLAIESEGGLRIDHCEGCKGYLKTYAGTGNEAVILADWTSLHLDVLAADRGLKRMAASLFDFESLLSQPGPPAG
jgi:FdhE protein